LAPPPFEYVQIFCENNIHKYLNVSKMDIKKWVIVGGYLGKEVNKILANFPNCEVIIFECSRRYSERLSIKFRDNPRVTVVQKAVSNVNGSLEFHETNLPGSGSIFKVGELSQKSYKMKNTESFIVESLRLDDYFNSENIDVLQIDVQGAEIKVIDGAENLLSNVKAIFSEVSINANLYEGAVVFETLRADLAARNFNLALLGTDYNLTGNALFVNNHQI
jgi:FkbM family methyltransferase